MTTLFLVRHASHDLLGATLAGGMPGVHLNERGRREASWAARRLLERAGGRPIEAIYTSPLERCLETARILGARLGLAPRVLDALVEIRFGAWTGRRFEDLRGDTAWQRFNERRSESVTPGGESMLDVERRIVGAIDLLRARHPGGAVLAVSHGDVLKAAVVHALGMSLDHILRFELDPASISTLLVDGTGVRVASLNEAPGAPAMAELSPGGPRS